MKIRVATQDDADAVQRVYLSAFPKEEGEIVSRLAVDLLSEETAPPVISLVSEADDIVVGHVAVSPIWMCDTRELIGYILAPLAVSPRYQKCGIGSQLIKSGIERLSETGSDILLVYGDPNFTVGLVSVSMSQSAIRRPISFSIRSDGRAWRCGIPRYGGLPSVYPAFLPSVFQPSGKKEDANKTRRDNPYQPFSCDDFP